MAILGAYIVPHPPLIIPEVGRGNEKAIQSTIDSYNEVAREIASLKPDTIVVISPHTTIYADYFHISIQDILFADLQKEHANKDKIHFYLI